MNNLKGGIENVLQFSRNPHREPQAQAGPEQPGLRQVLHRPHVHHGLRRGPGLA